MRKLFLIVLACLLCLLAQGSNDTVPQAPRPTVGLVLAGGGARGASFIGVLKYFEELDIPIDYVIGTSMGSVIGGIYALGYSPDEMAEIIRSVNWSKYIGNSLDRTVLSTQLRERHSSQLFNIPVNAMGIFKEGIINAILSDLPNAYVNNRALDNLLDRLCHGYQDEMDFNDLPIPFACIATDIVAGDEVVLRSGSLPKAIRASMAFPVIFSPVVIDGKLLYDGGLANLFPADVLDGMGADIIIGIEFAKDRYFTGGENPAFAQIADYLYNFAIHFKRDENKKLCDILIKPNISNFTALSFSAKAIDTLIDRGYQEAQKHHDELAQLKHRIDSMAGHPVGKELHAPKANNLNGTSVFVNNIEISGVPENQTNWLMRKGKLKPGRPLTMDDIEKATDIIRGTGAFNVVTYKLVETDSITQTYDLFLRLQPSNPDRYGLGIRYDNEDGAALMIDLGLNENRLTGWKLDLKGRLSFNPRVTTIATYSIFPIANLSLAYDYQLQLMKMSVPNLGSVRLRSETQEIKGYLSTFQALNLDASLGLSLVFTRFNEVSINDFESDTLLPVSPSTTYFTNNQLYGPYFSIKYDNLNDSYFATRGINTTVSGHLYFDPSHPGNPYEDLSLSFQGYLTPFNGKITLIPQIYSRIVFADAPYANFWNTMGGEVEGRHSPYQMPFVGFNNMLATNDLSTVLRCDLRYNFLRSHYISATYNFMFGYDSFEQIHDVFSATHYSGIGLRYSFNSILGPLSFTTQWSDYDRRFSLYFSFGYYF